MWGASKFLAVALALIAFFFSREASAYCLATSCDPATDTCTKNEAGCVKDGLLLEWTISPIPFRFYANGSKKLDDDKMRKAVRAAFKAWSSVECKGGTTSLKFEEGEDLTHDKPLGTSVRALEDQHFPSFGIYFRDKKWEHDDKSADSLAITSTGFSAGAEGAHMTYVDMEVNTAENAFTFASDQAEKDYDFQAVITHEVGHYFGLAHSLDPSSIMAPVYCQSSDRCGGGVKGKRALAQDDQDAVCALYPPSRVFPKSLQQALDDGDGTTAGCNASGGTGADPLWILCPTIAFALFRRRRSFD